MKYLQLMRAADFKYEINFEKREGIDHWILNNLENLKDVMDKCFENYNFQMLTNAFKDFYYGKFCDYYLEQTKVSEGLKQYKCQVLTRVIYDSMTLLHPIMPFITEEIYQALPFFESKKRSIVLESYGGTRVPVEKEVHFEAVIAIIKAIRSTLSKFKINQKKVVRAFVLLNEDFEIIEENLDFIQFICKLKSFSSTKGSKPGCY